MYIWYDSDSCNGRSAIDMIISYFQPAGNKDLTDSSIPTNLALDVVSPGPHTMD